VKKEVWEERDELPELLPSPGYGRHTHLPLLWVSVEELCALWLLSDVIVELIYVYVGISECLQPGLLLSIISSEV
jgi:hypothetical protein